MLKNEKERIKKKWRIAKEQKKIVLQSIIDLINLMLRRCAAVIAANGFFPKY